MGEKKGQGMKMANILRHSHRSRRSQRPLLRGGLLLLVMVLPAAGWLFKETGEDLRPFQASLRPQSLEFRRPQFFDRNGLPLSITYDNPWNVNDWLPLHEIPVLLQEAFLVSEDRRFYRHHGGDWLARAHALVQNARAMRTVRGASTITEQVVRILHPRPRTLWSRWLEGIEAGQLERRFSKTEILEFYLNQVPYARQRRGVLQAARLYFDRDLDTLNTAEMLTLAVLVRAPGRLEPGQGGGGLEKALRRLAGDLHRAGRIPAAAASEMGRAEAPPAAFRLQVDAGHFLRQAARLDGRQAAAPGAARIITTLDSGLQGNIQEILDHHLEDFKDLDLNEGAVLVVNHQTGEILAWVNGGGSSGTASGAWIDAVSTPRQPGSTLKPFLYSLALEKGWTPSTIIDDSPLSRPVGSGMHPFRNYSRKYYGPLRLREALGNSLNIPAVRTVQFTGVDQFLERLHRFGFASLNRPANHYGEGLALGNGEVTLFELVQAYSVLARGGSARPLRFTLDGGTLPGSPTGQILSVEAASLVADILSDPQARRLEFGAGNILRLPVQTAVKTGTSNDHRDSWAVGFNHRYTVGIWMGNLDRRPTAGVTGTTGPGLLLRSVFARLNRFEEARPLYLSPRLAVHRICRESGRLATPSCSTIQEKYLPGTSPARFCRGHGEIRAADTAGGSAEKNGMTSPIRLLQPTANLEMAMDPRIPDQVEAYPLKISGQGTAERIEWLVDGIVAGVTGGDQRHFMWPVEQGMHMVQARVWPGEGKDSLTTPAVRFVVK
jgi:penicillin-binding protein 1C